MQRYSLKVLNRGQQEFIRGRDILYNILTIQMIIDYAKEFARELVMILFDLENALDKVNCVYIEN